MTADIPPPSTIPAASVRLSVEGGTVAQWRIAAEYAAANNQPITLSATTFLTLLADLDRAERRLAAVEALVGKWEASAVEAESIAQARIGIADVMDYLVAAVVRRQCARDLNTALTADQPTAGGDEVGR